MIASYVQHGRNRRGFLLLREMDFEGIKPNAITFLGCSISIDTVLGTAIVMMYASCDSLENASDFEAATWFTKMELEGIKPDKNTYTTMLTACSSLQQGEIFLQRIRDAGYELDDVAVVSLIELYGRFEDLRTARDIFDSKEDRSVVTWTAMVAAYMNNESGTQDAWTIFQRMNLNGVKPNNVTFISLLGANCSFEKCKKLHELISSSTELTDDPFLAAALMNIYAKAGNLERVKAVFEDQATLQRSEICWNSVLRAYAERGHAYEVLETFHYMILLGVKPNTDTFIFVLHACSHAGRVKQACDLFNSISQDHNLVPAIQHYVCIIDLLGRAGWLENAQDLINKMPYQPNSLAWSTLLGACGMYGDTDRGAHAAKQVSRIENGQHGASYVLLSNIFAYKTAAQDF